MHDREPGGEGRRRSVVLAGNNEIEFVVRDVVGSRSRDSEGKGSCDGRGRRNGKGPVVRPADPKVAVRRRLRQTERRLGFCALRKVGQLKLHRNRSQTPAARRIIPKVVPERQGRRLQHVTHPQVGVGTRRHHTLPRDKQRSHLRLVGRPHHTTLDGERRSVVSIGRSSIGSVGRSESSGR